MIDIYPQTELKAMGDYGCLAMVYLWCAGFESNDASEWAKKIVELQKKGYVDANCYVKDAVKVVEYISGRKAVVYKQQCTDIRGITDRTPVEYSWYDIDKGEWHRHWVGVEEGRVAFDSLSYSVSVARGRPDEARIISWFKE